MKVLLRQYDGKYYVWKDAVYEGGWFVVTNNDGRKCRLNQNSIIAVKDDDRSKYAVCGNCGEMIKNDPASIEAHFAAKEAQRDCFKCGKLRKGATQIISVDATEADDGDFVVKETYKADLRCGQTYWDRPKINSEAAKAICQFYACRRAGVKQFEDVFTKYPNLFDKHITVDVLNAKKFVCDGKFNYHFEYDMKLRNTLKACVNELGIVDHFIVKCRGYRYKVYYSAKYDKLFFVDTSDYDERMPSEMSENKFNQVKAKISALYKEE